MTHHEAIEAYILQHMDEESDYLKALYRQAHVKLINPRMTSGHLQGRLLKMLVQLARPQRVLEIGTFAGYSALCMAEGLGEGALLHTYEIDDELEDFTRPWIEGRPMGIRCASTSAMPSKRCLSWAKSLTLCLWTATSVSTWSTMR